MASKTHLTCYLTRCLTYHLMRCLMQRLSALSIICGLFMISSISFAEAPLGFIERSSQLKSQSSRPYVATTPHVASLMLSGIGGDQPGPALLLNPAGMSVATQYELNGYYLRSHSEDNILGLHAVEALPGSQFALGLGYQTRFREGDLQEHYGLLGASLRLGRLMGRAIYGGVTTRYIYQSDTGDDAFDLDIGLLLPISQMISIGIVGRDALEELKLGAGLTFKIDHQLKFNLDFINETGSSARELRGGLQWFVNPTVTLLAGYLHLFDGDQSGSKSVSGGVGLFGLGGGQGRIDFSYTHSLIDDTYLFGVGLQGFINSRQPRRPVYR